MTSLYQISNAFLEALESAFDPETGEALPAFEEVRALFEGKGADVAIYILDVQGDAGKAKAAIERMQKYAEAKERKADALKKYLADNMRATGITRIKGEGFEVVLETERDESVEIDAGIVWPPELCNAPRPPSPSKTKIKAAILAGEPVAGARIVKKDRLTFK